jgi:hypothetical protein
MAESARITRSTDECEMSRSMPQSDVLESRLGVRAHDARQSANLFRGDRVALVRHRGRTLLTFGERFLGFANLGALEMADFEGNFSRVSRR